MDSYTSEVHATLNSCPETDGGHIARIRVSRPSRAFSSEVTPIIFDEDGDLMRESSRQPKEEEILLLLRHSMCSTLAEVGNQIWSGSLLLGDWIISHPESLVGNVLEIGSGTGLTALVAGSCIEQPLFSSYTITDLQSQLNLIRKNISLNAAFLVNTMPKFKVCHLDLFDLDPPPEWLKEVDVVLGGDVIYDEELTEGILDLIPRLKETAVLLFAVEKRYIFTQEDLEVTPHAYNVFIRGLRKRNLCFEEVTPLPRQKLCYHRSKDLSLVRVQSTY